MEKPVFHRMGPALLKSNSIKLYVHGIERIIVCLRDVNIYPGTTTDSDVQIDI